MLRIQVARLVKSGPERVVMEKLPLTPRGRRVIEYAVEEAGALNHNYVGTEHLLLGLIREDEGIAAQVLMNAGLKLSAVRQGVLNLLGVGVGDAGVSISMSDIWPWVNMTPEAKEVVEYAVEEAGTLNHDFLGPEHILLGLSLIQDEEGVIARALANLGFTLDDVRREVLKVLSEENKR